MFPGTQSKRKSENSSNHPAFEEIRLACRDELMNKGFETEVFLLPGGVGVKLLNKNHPPLAQIAHLPIIEFDFGYQGDVPLEHLSFFQLSGLKFSKSNLTSFSQISQFCLKKLHSDGVGASDFESLSVHRLKELSLRKTKVQSLDFLQESPVEILNLSQTEITDHALGNLNQKPLRKLDLLKCAISNINFLNDTKIEELILSGTQIDNITPISNCPIRRIELRATLVSDLSPLSSSPIEVLYLPGSRVSSLNEIAGCPITELNIVGLKIDDLSPLLTLPIKKLIISREQLTHEQVLIIEQLELEYLISPGDPDHQTPGNFFKKLEN
jgi:hypothetical protein